LEPIGEGAYGEVYRAYDPRLLTWVALKLLRAAEYREAQDEERFLDEARRLARVRHQNVIVVHGVDRHAGRVGFWSELLKGKTLEESLAQQGRFGAREATSIGLDLCRALAALHAAGVVHRDVKASNVMREEGGRIVLMDLGSGGELPPKGEMGVGEHLYGTPLAMAPEQLLGQVAGPATDIYGLGALLYRLVSGRHPFEASSLYELAEKHRSQEWTPLRDLRADLPSDFIQVVERALTPDPAGRYPSAGAMERALEATLGGRTIPSGMRAQTESPPAGSVGPPDQARDTTDDRGQKKLSVDVSVKWLRVALRVGVTMAVAVAVVIPLLPRMRRVWSASAGPEPRVRSMKVAPPPEMHVEAGPQDHLPLSPPQGPRATPSHEAAPLTARATLYRVAGGAEERLLPGAQVSPGDRLSMEIEGSTPMYVYVLNEDQDGGVFVLFPLPGLDLRNPIPPNVRVRLPGRLGGSAFDWQVTSAGGKESVITIASRMPLADLERDVASFQRAESGHAVTFGKVSGTALHALRGIGGLANDGGSTGRAGSLSQALKSLSSKEEIAGNIWVWQMELDNPEK
jgi:tRNA A-37 threonylcarbamoyl transferase component Bud32